MNGGWMNGLMDVGGWDGLNIFSGLFVTVKPVLAHDLRLFEDFARAWWI